MAETAAKTSLKATARSIVAVICSVPYRRRLLSLRRCQCTTLAIDDLIQADFQRPVQDIDRGVEIPIQFKQTVSIRQPVGEFVPEIAALVGDVLMQFSDNLTLILTAVAAFLGAARVVQRLTPPARVINLGRIDRVSSLSRPMSPPTAGNPLGAGGRGSGSSSCKKTYQPVALRLITTCLTLALGAQTDADSVKKCAGVRERYVGRVPVGGHLP